MRVNVCYAMCSYAPPPSHIIMKRSPETVAAGVPAVLQRDPVWAKLPVTPCLGTNCKAMAVKKLPPLGPVFTAAPGNWGGDVGPCGCNAGARDATGSRGGGERHPYSLGKFLSPRRRALGAHGP
jgi:hypothetical protein